MRIEAEAWTDLRFATLARLLRLAEPVDALIRTARLWGWQTEHYTPEMPTYVVDFDTVESAIGPGAAEALVRARLAEEMPEGYRIRGATGRIEWLWRLRQSARAGGEATSRKRRHNQAPGGAPIGLPAAAPPVVPMASPPIPVPIPVPEDQNSPPRAIPPSPESPPAATTGDAALRRRREIRAAIWAELGAARAEVAVELGLGPAAASLLAQDPGERALASKLLGARSEAELEQIAAQARHAIAISTAEAREARSVEWLTGVMFDSDRVWRRLLGVGLEDIGRGKRAGPRGSAERALDTVRKIKTL